MTPFADWEDQRFVTANRVEEAVLGIQNSSIVVSKTSEKVALPRDPDHHPERLKVYNWLAGQLKLPSFRQVEYLANELNDPGRLLGGWQRG